MLLLALATSVGGVNTPTDDETIIKRFLAGDLLTLQRAVVLRRNSGERVDVGRLGLLADLSRLVRCLPIGPIPQDEQQPYVSARRLVRLERVRLERLIRDNAHRGSRLADLVTPLRPYQTNRAIDRTRLVRWPREDEQWPGEVLDPELSPSDCPSRSGSKKERPAKVHRTNRGLRLKAERQAVAALLADLDVLPPLTGSRIALTYLVDASQTSSFLLNAQWRTKLAPAIAGGPPRTRVAGQILLARLAERDGAVDEATAHYRALLEDPALTAAEDSRVRVRLAVLLEPDWPSVLAAVRGVKKPRKGDEVVLINAEARALYSLGETEALMTLGRRVVLRADFTGAFHEQTNELLTLLALDLEPSRAIAWLQEIGPTADQERASRYQELAEMARERGRFDLAIAIYDRRRLDLIAALDKRSPRAAAEDAHLIARRSFIEYDREDVEAFAHFMDELVDMADLQAGRPIARYAPHKEVARLSQDLIGRLTDDVKGDAERRKFAALLLEAGTKLSVRASRYRPALQRYAPVLERLAGPFAVGRTKTAKIGAKTKSRRRQPKKPVKHLGEVVVSRLPPRLVPADQPTIVPPVRSFLMHEAADGTWVEAAPWPAQKKRRRGG